MPERTHIGWHRGRDPNSPSVATEATTGEELPLGTIVLCGMPNDGANDCRRNGAGKHLDEVADCIAGIGSDGNAKDGEEAKARHHQKEKEDGSQPCQRIGDCEKNGTGAETHL